ncbi:MAG: amidase [Proteobacteria bacterium]|nr:amidase [Pseudomonadota bacterium]
MEKSIRPQPVLEGPPYTLDATAAARLIRGEKLSAQELVRSCLERIAALDPMTHAWVHLDQPRSLARAKRIDEELARGRDPGVLAGIPVGIKDIFNTEDMPTEMGSPLWKNYRSGNDARVVFDLREEGAIILGKTVTAEFAVHTPGLTANPHDPAYGPGTSSSGSAAAVAASMVPVALGTQTAGSIIRPASYCGIYGLKPSFGLLPRTGILKTTDTLDTVGFFTRTPADLRTVFEVVRVTGTNYPLSHAALSDPARQNKGERPWRLGLVTDCLRVWDEAEDYAQRAIRDYADRLAAHGIEVEPLVLPADFNRAHEIHETIYDKTLSYYFEEEYHNKQLVSGIMRRLIEHGFTLTLNDYLEAMAVQSRLARRLDQVLMDYDAILTLSTGGSPLKGLDSMDRPDSCLIWTLGHAPSLNLPVFVGPEGLPFGAQLVARRFNDRLLLALVDDLWALELCPSGPHPPLEV